MSQPGCNLDATRTDPDVLARLAALEARVVELERLIAPRRRRTTSHADRRLLRVLRVAYGACVFDAATAAGDPLVRGLGLSASALGRRLARLAAGGHVERVGRTAAGCLWVLENDDG